MAEQFSIRLANIDDMKNVFDLSNDTIVRQNSIHTEKIEWENHIKWYKDKIQSPDSIFYVAYENDTFVGYCRLDKENNEWIITIHICSEHRNKGFGSNLIKYVCKKNSDKKIVSYVKNVNVFSQKLFIKNNFMYMNNKYIDNVKYIKYIKKEGKFVFIGHFVSALEEMCKLIMPDLVIVEDKHSANDVIDYCLNHAIPFEKVSSYNDILKVTKNIPSIDLTIVSSFGLILKDGYIKKNKYVVNFHPGDIPSCRGRHPLPCAIKYKHEFMGITAHIINDEEIDLGVICHKILLPIDYDKSYKYNEKKLLDVLPLSVNKIVKEYLETGEIAGVELKSSGNYYKPLSGNELNKIFNAEKLKDI